MTHHPQRVAVGNLPLANVNALQMNNLVARVNATTELNGLCKRILHSGVNALILKGRIAKSRLQA
jgi:hypothetical protein